MRGVPVPSGPVWDSQGTGRPAPWDGVGPPLTVACHEPTGQRRPSTAPLAPGHLPTCQMLEHVERIAAVRGTPYGGWLSSAAQGTGGVRCGGALALPPWPSTKTPKALPDHGASLLGTTLWRGRHPCAVEHTVYPRTVGIVGGGEEPLAREGGLEEDVVRPARGCWWGTCRGGSARSGCRGGGRAAAACTFVAGRLGTPRDDLDSHPWGHPRRSWGGGFVTARHGCCGLALWRGRHGAAPRLGGPLRTRGGVAGDGAPP